MSRTLHVIRIGLSLFLGFLVLEMFIPVAEATIAGTCKRRVLGGDADFGSGTHVGGVPLGDALVTWDYTTNPDTNEVVVQAQVQGTLYLDKLGSGTARLDIVFEDSGLFDIDEETIQFSGPGFNANDPANKRTVDVTLTHRNLRRVKLLVFTGSSSVVALCEAPKVSVLDIINSGTADFGSGGGAHLGGTPTSGGFIGLELRNDRTVLGEVVGGLFWDSSSAGCARIIIEFKSVEGNNLSTRTRDICGPANGNAQQSSNRRDISESLTNPYLFKIRLRVGTFAHGLFTGVTTRTYSFGPSVGVIDGVPPHAVTEVGQETTYGVRWTVPGPENWRSMDNMDVRIIDDIDEVLRFRWNEAENSFSLFNPRTGTFFPPSELGRLTRFEASAVTLLLGNTEVLTGGPSGFFVQLMLGLQFKPSAAGRTFRVEALGRDDSGGVQGWDEVGTIQVLPKR